MATELPGICGPANRPCKIAHASSYGNNVGIYPLQCLPSTFTIWHATFASQFSPALPLIGAGTLPPIGAGIVSGVFSGLGGLIFPTLPKTHTFQSHHYVIFARTANRFNISHTVTKEEVENIDEYGQSQIDLGEYIFDILSATKNPVDDIENQIALTDAEEEALDNDPNCSQGCSAESIEDRKFRKLFELNIPNNLLVGIVPNTEGVEYRLDNGSRKSKSAVDQSGLGDLDNPSYRDGTSKKVTVQFARNASTPHDSDVKEGDVLYFNYVAVREHYIRQRVTISWQVFDPGTAEFASTCVSLPLGYSISHYRFYEWETETDAGQESIKLAGWRIVESFNSDVNFVAAVSSEGSSILADFIVGRPDFGGIKKLPVLPGLCKMSELQTFISDRSNLSYSDFVNKYGVNINLTDYVDNGAYHINAGKKGTTNTVYQGSDWFQRNQFSKYSDRLRAGRHVFYNVHPKALKKRDIDKWGIERYLAIEIEKDIHSGKLTFFPFMDDPAVDNPTDGTNEYLDQSNLVFDPIKPVSSYGGNFEAVCGSIGSFPTNPSDGINSYHSFESNRIDERFDIDTHVLVERNFAVGAGTLGPNLITIECAGGAGGALSCILDPSGKYAFTSHANDDNFIIFNPFNMSYLDRGFRKLVFRPDQEPDPRKGNTSPSPDQFEELLGFTGMLGDLPGYQPGKAVSPATFSKLSELVFKTTDVEALKSEIPDLSDDQIEEITFTNDSNLQISASSGYFGSVKIVYSISDGDAIQKPGEVILLAKKGSSISGVIDSIFVIADSKKTTLVIDFRWMKADNFELIGPRVEYMKIKSITVKGISNDRAHDFLTNSNSHGSSEFNLSSRLQGRNLFFETPVTTMSEDKTSIVYIFFSDADGGISAIATNDFGISWYYQYGIIEQINKEDIKYPFAVTDFDSNTCYLFHLYRDKILCKTIPFSMLRFEDANLIERFSDIYTSTDTADSDSVAQEKESIYTIEGNSLRRRIPSFVAQGDMTDVAFLEILGKTPDEAEYQPFEIRQIEDTEISARKFPVARSPGTAFTSRDQKDMFFSAYHNNIGELKLWFMGETSNGAELQCNISSDNGQTWYDFWEFAEFGYSRLRYDSEKKTQFINRSISGDYVPSKDDTDPQKSNEIATFGINVHWSRLRRHKINTGDSTLYSESQVLDISSPYLFYQSATDKVFLFYIYQSCLLCKVFSDSIFANAVDARQSNAKKAGMEFIKEIIEQQTRAHFIDGSLTSIELREEIHRHVQDEEKMSEGNIIFRYSFVETFTDDRSIPDQRICAHELPNGSARVFYKHNDSNNIRAAIWTGSEWWAEDLLKSPADLPDMDKTDDEAELVVGGFNNTGFTD